LGILSEIEARAEFQTLHRELRAKLASWANNQSFEEYSVIKQF
jgi:hypothetical protein